MEQVNDEEDLTSSSNNNNYSQKFAGSVMHLQSLVQKQLLQMLVNLKVVAQSLNDLRPADVQVFHESERLDDQPIYFKPQRLPPLMNQIVHKELVRCSRDELLLP